jgi:hypothetical protein
LRGALAIPASGAFAAEEAASKVITCKPIKTSAQLQAIDNDLNGTYCLVNHALPAEKLHRQWLSSGDRFALSQTLRAD